MTGSGSSMIDLSSTSSREFSLPRSGSSNSGFDSSSRASSSKLSSEMHDGASNFFHQLKEKVQEKVQGVLNAQQNSHQNLATSGSISLPTTTTEQPLSSRPSVHASLAASVGPSLHQLSQEIQMMPLHNDGREPHIRHGEDEVAVSTLRDPRGETASLEDFYSINWTPKEIFLKFRQQVEGFQLGTNFEFDGLQINECNTKLVFKPVGMDRKWKFICEPKYGDVRLLTKKIPIGPLLNLQVGIGHDWHSGMTGWKWKVTSAFGASGHTQIRHKTRLSVTSGLDLRVGWNAEYVLPDLHGALGTGDPTIGLNLGHLYASVERLEAIYTQTT